jgi:hypothetical protein
MKSFFPIVSIAFVYRMAVAAVTRNAVSAAQAGRRILQGARRDAAFQQCDNSDARSTSFAAQDRSATSMAPHNAALPRSVRPPGRHRHFESRNISARQTRGVRNADSPSPRWLETDNGWTEAQRQKGRLPSSVFAHCYSKPFEKIAAPSVTVSVTGTVYSASSALLAKHSVALCSPSASPAASNSRSTVCAPPGATVPT